LLPEKFHHLLCSYTALGSSTSLNCGDRTVHDDVGYIHSSDCDVTDVSNVTDSASGYCVSTTLSNAAAGAGGGGGTDAVTANDVLPISSSQLNSTVINNTQPSCSAGRITDTDAHNIVTSSHDAAVCDDSPSLHIGRVGFKAKLRVNVENFTELELWQRSFAERSKTTMRCAGVSICTGKKTLYKVNTPPAPQLNLIIINLL